MSVAVTTLGRCKGPRLCLLFTDTGTLAEGLPPSDLRLQVEEKKQTLNLISKLHFCYWPVDYFRAIGRGQVFYPFFHSKQGRYTRTVSIVLLPAFCCWYVWENHDYSLGKMQTTKEMVLSKDTKGKNLCTQIPLYVFKLNKWTNTCVCVCSTNESLVREVAVY